MRNLKLENKMGGVNFAGGTGWMPAHQNHPDPTNFISGSLVSSRRQKRQAGEVGTLLKSLTKSKKKIYSIFVAVATNS